MNTLLCNGQSANLLMKLYTESIQEVLKSIWSSFMVRRNTSCLGSKQRFQIELTKPVAFLKKQSSKKGVVC